VDLLSNNMAFELRERQGLAYSVGAGVAFYDDRARLSAGIGTRVENIDAARQGMESAIREFDSHAIAKDDILKLTKKDVGRQRMRQITRIGQAYALTMDELAGRPLGSSREASADLLEVEPEDIRRVTDTYLRDVPLVTVIVR
jgi:predicted Zn-dependent peptidase